MITIDHKLYIIDDVNEIIVSYAKNVVLRKLLNQFSFDFYDDQQNVSDTVMGVNINDDDLLGQTHRKDMRGFITDFLKKCNKKELKSLYFWLLNLNYNRYFEDFINHQDSFDDDENIGEATEILNFNFGRELAYKLYNPECVETDVELHQELQNYVLSFALEFSFWDGQNNVEVAQEISAKIDYYCANEFFDALVKFYSNL